ncbi:hypothetical protein THASP1DRAFT_29006 [Thamnocephalis sphaerospora]|uniref:Tyrosinase copper-binding domain-containing protein n=1 Tax=Thamnocephalis sphaerospora TaxID=78915 RepID=A0A4V1IWY8_9FUNG|nr:hypothetical protein THASP1DRAFT_29006 [Thamnocephalis sphaerospora]|eukprot:RKP09209.1 hypothetical protein THASP1DRAFT_29006 [Thamnocephalis sphaerospora]
MTDAKPHSSGCTRIMERREIRTLSDKERNTYFSAIKQLQSGAAPTVYDSYVSLHWKMANSTHGFPEFLPWHRAFILDFERTLQKIDASIVLPYWDWTYDSQAPELAPIWRSDWYGGNGRPGDNCVTDGQWADWRPFYPQPHCLHRNWDGNNTMSAYYSPEITRYLQTTAQLYDDFRVRLEAPPHAQVHNSIGGEMPTMFSPNDPVFYLHHAYIDKAWSEWQALSPRNARAYDGTNADGTPAKLSSPLTGLPYRVSDVIDIGQLCYTYIPFPGTHDSDEDGAPIAHSTPPPSDAVWNGTSPNAFERQNLYKLRAPILLLDSVILMNQQIVGEVRRLEALLRVAIDEFNSLPGYISPAALINRPDFVKRLSGTDKDPAAGHSSYSVPSTTHTATATATADPGREIGRPSGMREKADVRVSKPDADPANNGASRVAAKSF